MNGYLWLLQSPLKGLVEVIVNPSEKHVTIMAEIISSNQTRASSSAIPPDNCATRKPQVPNAKHERNGRNEGEISETLTSMSSSERNIIPIRLMVAGEAQLHGFSIKSVS